MYNLNIYIYIQYIFACDKYKNLAQVQHDFSTTSARTARGEELQRFPAEGFDACGESTQGWPDISDGQIVIHFGLR